MEPLASPIRISIVRSVTVAWLVCGGHVFIVLIFLVAFPLNEYLVAALVGLLISLRIQCLSQCDLFKRIDAVPLRSDDRYSVLTHKGEVLSARLTGTTLVSLWPVILWLKPRGQRRIHFILIRDNTDTRRVLPFIGSLTRANVVGDALAELPMLICAAVVSPNLCARGNACARPATICVMGSVQAGVARCGNRRPGVQSMYAERYKLR